MDCCCCFLHCYSSVFTLICFIYCFPPNGRELGFVGQKIEGLMQFVLTRVLFSKKIKTIAQPKKIKAPGCIYVLSNLICCAQKRDLFVFLLSTVGVDFSEPFAICVRMAERRLYINNSSSDGDSWGFYGKNRHSFRFDELTL